MPEPSGFYPPPQGTPTRVPAPIPGMAKFGNIDLTDRPRVPNPDGSYSSVYSMGANLDGMETLLPLVADEGQMMSEAEAIERFRRTGRHLGQFYSPEASESYAQQLHSDQERQGNARAAMLGARVEPAPVMPSEDDLTAGLLADKQSRQAKHGLRERLLDRDDPHPRGPIYLDETADPFYHAPPPAKSPPIAKDTPKKKRRRGVP